MTTKPSSSPHASSATPKTLYDAARRPIPVGNEIGRGGEGSVYEVANDRSVVVKIYHKILLEPNQIQKLRVMANSWSGPLEQISAWPRKIVSATPKGDPCGLLMQKMEGAHPLHELYGTSNRRRHFPDVGWHHLVLAARNVAAAFNTLHAAGIVVGDVNQGNLLVDKQMCVKMIDCDSFQISRGDKTYTCAVGSPHFTPPELQGQRLRDVIRTVNHDRFGLATLIFHLLFVGRHPFAGRFRGQGDMPIEKAIAESRFAFSRNRNATLVDPPPASLLLDDLPNALGDLFEAAFRPTETEGDFRPSPQQWIGELELLIKRRRACDVDPMHVFAPESGRCPWCRIEDVGGPSFFLPADVPSAITSLRMARLDETVTGLPEVKFPVASPERLALPTLPPLRVVKPLPRRKRADYAAALLVVSGIVALAGAFHSLETLAAGIALSVASAGYLLAGPPSRENRTRVEKYYAKLAKQWRALQSKVRTIEIQQRQRLAEFQIPAKELEKEKQHYRAEGDALVRVIVENRHAQLDEHLRNLSIRDHVHMVAGMSLSQVTLLESFGVETALDVEHMKLYGIPTIHESAAIALLQWRAEMERRFRFNPEHGITLDNLKSIGDAVVRRFKMMQARKVLAGDERLKMLADTGKNQLVAALTPFDAEVRQWKDVAKELCELQESRRPLERLLNRSLATLLLPTLGVIALAVLFYYVK
ncbi:MAG: hypothetical protein WD971_00095 [Pirellulales bacterium]